MASEWVASGAFTVSSSQSKISLTPHRPSDFSSAVANDALRLSLAGRETLHNISQSRNLDSLHPAWSSIQIYYAAFYYASAFLRIVGTSQSFLQVKEISSLRALLNAMGHPLLPGTGLYQLTFNQSGTAIEFSKLNLGSHEALWTEMRSYIQSLKSRIPQIGSMTVTEQSNACSQLDAISKATLGLHSQPNISSTRNEVQYRQKLSCWYPYARKIKNFHATDRISQALAPEFLPHSILQTDDTYDGFFSKSLAICGFLHQVIVEIAKFSEPKTFGARYFRYCRTVNAF